jgi:hypothetical protein
LLWWFSETISARILGSNSTLSAKGSFKTNSSTVMTRPNPHLSTHLKILGRG